MALGKIDMAKESVKRRSSERTVVVGARYSSCKTVTEAGGRVRLGFKRYSDFDAGESSFSRKGAVSPGSETRVDCMAKDAYDDSRLKWVLFMFNRQKTTDVNPLRFVQGSVISVPGVSYVSKRLREDVIIDV